MYKIFHALRHPFNTALIEPTSHLISHARKHPFKRHEYTKAELREYDEVCELFIQSHMNEDKLEDSPLKQESNARPTTIRRGLLRNIAKILLQELQLFIEYRSQLPVGKGYRNDPTNLLVDLLWKCGTELATYDSDETFLDKLERLRWMVFEIKRRDIFSHNNGYISQNPHALYYSLENYESAIKEAICRLKAVSSQRSCQTHFMSIERSLDIIKNESEEFLSHIGSDHENVDITVTTVSSILPNNQDRNKFSGNIKGVMQRTILCTDIMHLPNKLTGLDTLWHQKKKERQYQLLAFFNTHELAELQQLITANCSPISGTTPEVFKRILSLSLDSSSFQLEIFTQEDQSLLHQFFQQNGLSSWTSKKVSEVLLPIPFYRPFINPETQLPDAEWVNALSGRKDALSPAAKKLAPGVPRWVSKDLELVAHLVTVFGMHQHFDFLANNIKDFLMAASYGGNLMIFRHMNRILDQHLNDLKDAGMHLIDQYRELVAEFKDKNSNRNAPSDSFSQHLNLADEALLQVQAEYALLAKELSTLLSKLSNKKQLNEMDRKANATVKKMYERYNSEDMRLSREILGLPHLQHDILLDPAYRNALSLHKKYEEEVKQEEYSKDFVPIRSQNQQDAINHKQHSNLQIDSSDSVVETESKLAQQKKHDSWESILYFECLVHATQMSVLCNSELDFHILIHHSKPQYRSWKIFLEHNVRFDVWTWIEKDVTPSLYTLFKVTEEIFTFTKIQSRTTQSDDLKALDTYHLELDTFKESLNRYYDKLWFFHKKAKQEIKFLIDYLSVLQKQIKELHSKAQQLCPEYWLEQVEQLLAKGEDCTPALKKASELGDHKASYLLTICYHYGLTTLENKDSARFYSRSSYSRLEAKEDVSHFSEWSKELPLHMKHLAFLAAHHLEHRPDLEQQHHLQFAPDRHQLRTENFHLVPLHKDHEWQEVITLIYQIHGYAPFDSEHFTEKLLKFVSTHPQLVSEAIQRAYKQHTPFDHAQVDWIELWLLLEDQHINHHHSKQPWAYSLDSFAQLRRVVFRSYPGLQAFQDALYQHPSYAQHKNFLEQNEWNVHIIWEQSCQIISTIIEMVFDPGQQLDADFIQRSITRDLSYDQCYHLSCQLLRRCSSDSSEQSLDDNSNPLRFITSDQLLDCLWIPLWMRLCDAQFASPYSLKYQDVIEQLERFLSKAQNPMITYDQIFQAFEYNQSFSSSVHKKHSTALNHFVQLSDPIKNTLNQTEQLFNSFLADEKASTSDQIKKTLEDNKNLLETFLSDQQVSTSTLSNQTQTTLEHNDCLLETLSDQQQVSTSALSDQIKRTLKHYNLLSQTITDHSTFLMQKGLGTCIHQFQGKFTSHQINLFSQEGSLQEGEGSGEKTRFASQQVLLPPTLPLSNNFSSIWNVSPSAPPRYHDEHQKQSDDADNSNVKKNSVIPLMTTVN